MDHSAPYYALMLFLIIVVGRCTSPAIDTSPRSYAAKPFQEMGR